MQRAAGDGGERERAVGDNYSITTQYRSDQPKGGVVPRGKEKAEGGRPTAQDRYFCSGQWLAPKGASTEGVHGTVPHHANLVETDGQPGRVLIEVPRHLPPLGQDVVVLRRGGVGEPRPRRVGVEVRTPL